MNYTEHCNLPQWEGGDRVLREDFNAAMSAIDEKIGETAQALSQCGNCSLVCGTYTGTGDKAGQTITFEKKPVIVFVYGVNRSAFAIYGADAVAIEGSTTYPYGLGVTWTEYSVRFNHGDNEYKALNVSGKTYYYAALLQA